MTMHVDEAWRNDEARAVDRLESIAIGGVVGNARSDRFYSIADNEDVAHRVVRLRRIDDSSAAQQNRATHRSPPACFADSASSGLPPERRYSTAIRIATPFVTWFKMTLNGPSATSESISTPRFIGPGWRMR